MPTYDRVATYEQAKKHLQLLAGIHAAIVGDVAEDDWGFVKRTVINGGGPAAFPVGSILTTTKDDYVYPWAVMHHGEHSDGRPYMHLRVIKAINNMQFDAAEAFYYAENGLPAGTYYVTVPTAWSRCAAGDYSFTLANAVPAGGRLVGFYRCADVDPTGSSVTVYDAANSNVVSQTSTAIVKETNGTYLCSLAAGGDTNDANANSLQRAGYGNGNYAQSAIRQWITSSAAAGSVWAPTNKFDQAPNWVSNQAGFMARLPQDFIDIVNPVEIETITNNIFEVDYTKNSSYTLEDKFWLPSRYQIFGTTEGSDLSETQWDYYKDATDADRIMYNTSGSAQVQWLRSPNPGHAHYARHVYTSGALNYHYAYIAFAVAPACEISAPVA